MVVRGGDPAPGADVFGSAGSEDSANRRWTPGGGSWERTGPHQLTDAGLA